MKRKVKIRKPSVQARAVRRSANDLMRGVILGSGGTALMLALIVGFYLAKSAAGIDIIPGHSPFHDYLYHLVR